MSDYLTTREVAERFGVTHQTIARWLKRGHLHGRRKGPGITSDWLIPESEVRRLEAQLAGTPPPQEAGHAEETQTE